MRLLPLSAKYSVSVHSPWAGNNIATSHAGSPGREALRNGVVEERSATVICATLGGTSKFAPYFHCQTNTTGVGWKGTNFDGGIGGRADERRAKSGQRRRQAHATPRSKNLAN